MESLWFYWTKVAKMKIVEYHFRATIASCVPDSTVSVARVMSTELRSAGQSSDHRQGSRIASARMRHSVEPDPHPIA
jgi:hypothetical protein